jgi:DNA polymerase elongation subunit (family B)
MISNFEGEPAVGAAILPESKFAAIREPNVIVFDIETGPRPVAEIESLMPEFEAPANYKDPVKIAEVIDAKRAAWIEKAALSPLTGRVIAIGALIDGIYSSQVVEPFAEERDLIAHFWSLLGKNTLLVGFNSNRFDLPFLFRRSWALGITPPPRFSGRGFGGSLDLMEAWQMGDRNEFVSLDTVAKFLGCGAKTGSGAHFAELMKFDVALALRYLENDVMLTARVATRLGFDVGLADESPEIAEAKSAPGPTAGAETSTSVVDDDY